MSAIRQIYLDGTATTKPTKLALDAFNDVCQRHWLNPSSTTYSADAKNLLEKAREIISDWICCRPDQVFFTSGSTEAANWVIQTFPDVRHMRDYGYIESPIEHPCVNNTIDHMIDQGCFGYEVAVDKTGLIDLGELEMILRAVKGDRRNVKALVAVMDSNNELGTLEPTKAISELCHQFGMKYLCDMTQSFAHSFEIDVTHLGMDYAFGSAQKFGAPRGAGFLYVKDPKTLKPFMFGGHQENGMRAGTENLAAIWAMAVQFNEIASMRFVNDEKIRKLRSYLLENLPEGVEYNLAGAPVVPSIVSLKTECDANKLITALSMDGIYLSAGSACSTGENKPSRILKACGFSDDEARRTIRVSLNENLTTEDLDYFIGSLKNCQNLLKE